jgi:hypothetical protein
LGGTLGHRRAYSTARGLVAGAALLALVGPARPAAAQEIVALPQPPPGPAPRPDLVLPIPREVPEKLDPRRFEWAGFPIIGGNSDIGVQFGVAATFTRFREGVNPYFWNLDVVLSTSVKGDASGVGFIQQADVLRLDAPDLWNHHLRVDTRGSFTRTINEGYYGIGNASSAGPTNVAETNEVRLNQYIQEEARVRAIARVHTGTLFDLALGGNLRYEWPTVYAGSKLAIDSAQGGGVYGVQDEGLASLAAGIMIDTRDNEFITTSGIYYQVGLGGTVGSAEGIAYGQASAVLAHYAPLGSHVIFASRIVADWEFGRVPFYDLQQGGLFEPQILLGPGGIRGIPDGRYAGPIKVVGNVEIRVPFPRFRLFGQRFRLGTTTFFDTGRVWAGYTVDPARDGTALGLKYGVGAGAFLQWGEAAIFRVEAAYSPDAESENPGFPIGIYVSDGLMF